MKRDISNYSVDGISLSTTKLTHNTQYTKFIRSELLKNTLLNNNNEEENDESNDNLKELN
jgi:hypothetical protein